MTAIEENLIDVIWEGQPDAPMGKVDALPLIYSGKTSVEKICQLRADLHAAKLDAMLVSMLDEIACFHLYLY